MRKLFSLHCAGRGGLMSWVVSVSAAPVGGYWEGVPVLRGKMPCWEGATGVVPTGLLRSLDMPALLVGPQLLSLS